MCDEDKVEVDTVPFVGDPLMTEPCDSCGPVVVVVVVVVVDRCNLKTSSHKNINVCSRKCKHAVTSAILIIEILYMSVLSNTGSLCMFDKH